MFLLTFVTLVIAFIGVYAQVLIVQTARLNAQQNGVAQAMQTWHTAAVSMAASIIKTNGGTYGGTPCSLTNGFTVGTISLCPTPKCTVPPTVPNDSKCTAPGYINPPPVGAAQLGSGSANSGTVLSTVVVSGIPNPQMNLVYNTTTNLTECVRLPATCKTNDILTGGPGNCTKCTQLYDIADYQFNSVLFQNGGQNFVVTFIQPAVISASNPAPGFLSLSATGAQIGLTASDLMQQLQNSGLPNYTYGAVSLVNSGGVFVTLNTGSTPGSPSAATSFSYILPASLSAVPGGITGAVAIIGSPDGF